MNMRSIAHCIRALLVIIFVVTVLYYGAAMQAQIVELQAKLQDEPLFVDHIILSHESDDATADILSEVQLGHTLLFDADVDGPIANGIYIKHESDGELLRLACTQSGQTYYCIRQDGTRTTHVIAV